MALILSLKQGHKIIVNGAVLENITGKTISISVRNEAAILRAEDILTAEDAVTPATRVYFSLQNCYLFPESRPEYLTIFKALVSSYVEAAPSAVPIVEAIGNCLAAEQYYAALKQARELIDHERKVLSDASERLAKELCGTAGAGQSAPNGSVGADSNGAKDEGGPGLG